jgi:hypothetical protein
MSRSSQLLLESACTSRSTSSSAGMSIWSEPSGFRTETRKHTYDTRLCFIYKKIKFYSLHFAYRFYVQIFDRLQTRAASLLIPLDYFVIESDAATQMQTSSTFEAKQVHVISEQSSSTWLNVCKKKTTIKVFVTPVSQLLY